MNTRGITVPARCFAAFIPLLTAAGCRAPADSPPPLGALANALLELSDEAAVELDLDVPSGRAGAIALRELITEAEVAIDGRDRADIPDQISQLLFSTLGMEREVIDAGVAWMLLPEVLERRRGSCLGLTSLYLVLAEQLDLPAHGVLAPGHLFVRSEAGSGEVNLELLRRGEHMPDAWYVEKYEIPSERGIYLRDLSSEQVVAVLRYNLGNTLRDLDRAGRAIRHYRAAIAHLPELAELHASMGLAYHILKDFDRAEQAYLEAAERRPGLPGLRANLAALYLARPSASSASSAPR